MGTYRYFQPLLLCGLMIFTAGKLVANDRPNVILIVADDLGWADLGCYGSRFHQTPNLDRLAAGGQRFTQAYAACCVCSPTRAALMTGKHPARLHLTDWLPGRPDRPDQKLKRPAIRQQLPLDEKTVAEALQEAGYVTGHLGKWHLGGEGFEPTRQGFASSIAGDDRGSPASYFAPYLRAGRAIPGLEDAPAGEYLTDRLTLEAEKFIEANKAKPFFLYLPHFAVHTPMIARDDIQAKYPKWDGVPHGRQENPIYAAMLESLDSGVGRIMEKLKQLGLEENTLVVFTSDNGGLATGEGARTPATINAPLREGKGWSYEGGLRVPLIVSWPKHIAAGSNPAVVWSPDLPVTIASLCGAALPTAVDGVDLSGLLLEGKQLEPRTLYWHYPHYSNQGGRPSGAIRDGAWKLVEFYESGRRELFNLAEDLSENRNLAPRHPERVEELAGKLSKWREQAKVQMPTANTDYVPNPQNEDGLVVLPAKTAEVHGVMLRYEPLPHKNTLGFWVEQDDWAEWEFELRQPGTFQVRALVGCGNGNGGSRVVFRVAGNDLELQVPETGGFQQFRPIDLGVVSLEQSGRHRVEVRVLEKAKQAVMDVREVRLIPKN